jgi:hypothetical protein
MKLKIRLDKDLKEFIEIAGCASHSSRPHPTPPAPKDMELWVKTELFKNMLEIPELWKVHDAQVAKAAREQVLHKIDDTIMKKETWSRLELLAIIAEQMQSMTDEERMVKDANESKGAILNQPSNRAKFLANLKNRKDPNEKRQH